MNLSAKALWIACGIAVVAIVCCIAIDAVLRSEGKIEARQQADIKKLSIVRDADNSAQVANDVAKKKADEDAQKKTSILDSISTDLDGPDLVHGLQWGLRGGGEGADSGADPAGKLAATLPGTNDAARTDANVRH